MKNANLKEDKKTTITGFALIAIALLIVLAPMFIEVKKDYTDMGQVPAVIGGLGFLLVFMSDKLFSGIGKTIDKGTDKL